MKYHLLTGATGLLGRYLMRDLTMAGLPLAVLARTSNHENAHQRIETAISHWEKELGRALLRPVVLTGDIAKPQLGLGAQEVTWVQQYCDTIIHAAASLTFYAKDSDPGTEPWRSNISGTRNVLDLCRTAGIRALHHVSTAYVCGNRRGIILETELDEGQDPSNDYERSKVEAEKDVSSARHLDCVTIYRPSIIVGDSQTGYTTSYHGFYMPLRLAYTMATNIPWKTLEQGDYLGGLQINGKERKNLVPVDWVSAAMTQVISTPALHGQTYHLTNPECVTAADMLLAIVSAASEIAKSKQREITNAIQVDEVMINYREQMRVYQSYWHDDPAFDSTQTKAALPHLPCPQITQDVMDRLINYAIKQNFGWPREASAIPANQWQDHWQPWFAQAGQGPARSDSFQYINLRISGAGGGQWHMMLETGRLKGLGLGFHPQGHGLCSLNTSTLAALAQGRISWDRALDSGRFMISGMQQNQSLVRQLLCGLLHHDATSPG